MNKLHLLCSFMSLCLGYSFAAEDSRTECVINYLYDYGYMEEGEMGHYEDEEKLRFAISRFQEHYNLAVDGELDNETMALINKPRCGVSDDIDGFNTRGVKWDMKNIKWHYVDVSEGVVNLAGEAFGTWEKYAEITFTHDASNPNILISNKRGVHRTQKSRTICSNNLDGEGGTLAHAEFPSKGGSLLEIHVDQDEKWYYTKDNLTSEGEINLFTVLLHEIGHTLGISHSANPNAVMFPFYSLLLDLHDDDISAVQSLYGKQENRAGNRSLADPTTKPPNLCELNDNINLYLIVNQYMYIFHEKWVWMIDVENLNNETEIKSIHPPLLITDWLKFLPSNFKNITAIYQRPSGEIALFLLNRIYLFTFPDLKLLRGYPKNISILGLHNTVEINAVVNTYSGRTFIFYGSNYVIEVDECSFYLKRHGVIRKMFPGIPSGVKSAFRYTNGRLYFFNDKNFFEFSEFENVLTRAGLKDISLFGLTCPKDAPTTAHQNLLSALQNLITQFA